MKGLFISVEHIDELRGCCMGSYEGVGPEYCV